MNVCSNPLDPSEIEALASGETPAGTPAAEHAARCGSCGQAVRRAEGLGGLLEDALSFSPPAPPDLADRVLRIRPFSRAERRSLAIWRAPLLLLLGLTATGSAMVAGLAGGREQIGLAAAMLGSLAGLLRACIRWLLDVSRSAPAGLDALAQALRPTSAGWVALLLLLPAVFALRKVLARASARR
ncbi:MAG: hypothetical protein ACM3SU_00335 [Acidobacteriota bacterium]